MAHLTSGLGRPPLGRAEAALQDVDLRFEEFDLHGMVTDLGLEIVDECVAMIRLARLQSDLHGGERLVTPRRELRGGDANLAADGIKRLTAQESEDDLSLAAT